MKNESEALANEIISSLPQTNIKQLDYVALAAMIMEIIKFLMNLWKKNKTVSEADAVAIQDHARSLGFVGRFLVKNKLRRHMHKYSKHPEMFSKIEHEVFSKTIEKLSVLPPKVMYGISQENING